MNLRNSLDSRQFSLIPHLALQIFPYSIYLPLEYLVAHQLDITEARPQRKDSLKLKSGTLVMPRVYLTNPRVGELYDKI
jgi:hypothetical protein